MSSFESETFPKNDLNYTIRRKFIPKNQVPTKKKMLANGNKVFALGKVMELILKILQYKYLFQSIIPMDMPSQMPAVPCGINQTHLCGNTYNQHIHPSPLCTSGEGLLTCTVINITNIYKSTNLKILNNFQ